MAASQEAKQAVAFGSTLDRELLPLKVPANRFGNELALRGAPNRGPGCYNNAEVSGFVYELEQQPVCRRGYSLGARTAPRFPKPGHMDVPGAPAYQAVISKPRQFEPAFKPFDVGAAKLPDVSKGQTAHPGPGAYEHSVKRNRKVKFHGSFGGPQALIAPVQIKCNEFGEPDICNSCSKPPVGDYYENKKVHLCRTCFEHHVTTGDKFPKRYLQSFYKVRDCSNIHNHEGTNAKLRLQTEKEMKKQRFREAYMSLYF